MSFEVFATNVFDKRNDCRSSSSAAYCTRTPLIVPGRPRTIGIRAGMKF